MNKTPIKTDLKLEDLGITGESAKIFTSELNHELALTIQTLKNWAQRIIKSRKDIEDTYPAIKNQELERYSTKITKLVTGSHNDVPELEEFWCEVSTDEATFQVFFAKSGDTFMQLDPGFKVRKYTGKGSPKFGSVALIGTEGYQWENLETESSISRKLIAIALYKSAKDLCKYEDNISIMLQSFPPQTVEVD